jgi:DNA-binding response OmpR family regulator
MSAETGKACVLIVDDDDAVRSMLAASLRARGFSVLVAADGEAGVAEALRARPDVMLVDLVLPNKHGLDVIAELRARGLREHIIAISGIEPDRYAVAAIESGADAWLTKPMDIHVLEAHVRSGLRRAREYASTTPVTTGDLTYNPMTGAALRGSRRFSLSLIERALTSLGIRHAGRVLSVDELWRAAWPQRADDAPLDPREIHSVEVAMSRLAAKLNGPDERPVVVSVADARRRRLGYVFHTSPADAR